MITFQRIRYINFMATGAGGNEVILNRDPSTLISARNGHGKSLICDALVFALFGKPYRNITKNQLINSVNGKNCLVELWFEINGAQYLVRRGIKPNIFEIFRNDELIDQDAAVRDYQKFFEQQILKTNLKAFTQSVILGSANFTPFMQMKTYERREVIEDFLDVKIYGVMHAILKEEINATKSDLARIDSNFSVGKAKVEGQKKLIEKLAALNAQAEEVIRGKIDAQRSLISLHKSTIEGNDRIIGEMQGRQVGMHEMAERISELREKISYNNHQITTKTKTIKFFDTNQQCPSCNQEIQDEHKKPVIKGIAKECLDLTTEVNSMNEEMEDLCTKYDVFLEVDGEIQKIHDSNRELNRLINAATRDIQSLEDEITSMSSSDILNEKVKLKEYAGEMVAMIEEKTKLSDIRAMQDQAYEILKDTGVKTTIIKEYLPIINKLINQYLSVMEFYVDFTLDENFNEVVRSRCRDEFTYMSFSEGEKKRLDIAILFAWRYVAKLKNSVNCNILFLDEILESGLDEGGLDAVFQIIEEESKRSNVFVMSHADRFKEKFSNVINIEKRGDFSVIVDSAIV